jgi:hypothetical protein
MTRTSALTVLLLIVKSGLAAATSDSNQPPMQWIHQTKIIGDVDPVLWKRVLDVLPVRPTTIQVLDLDTLSIPTRQKLGGLDGFVLSGHATIVVIRQGATLRQAEFGDAVDRLMLASLVWHEMAHLSGADERTAFAQEETLWHRFIATGGVPTEVGLGYIARLREASTAQRGASAR